jgi:hypothetical protein
LLVEIPGEPDEGEEPAESRAVVIELIDRLEPPQLVEVLKWPVSVGEPERIVRAALTRKTQIALDDNLCAAMKQLEGLNLPQLDRGRLEQSPHRPQAEDALNELDSFRRG